MNGVFKAMKYVCNTLFDDSASDYNLRADERVLAEEKKIGFKDDGAAKISLPFVMFSLEKNMVLCYHNTVLFLIFQEFL
jgi:hypothetical protein